MKSQGLAVTALAVALCAREALAIDTTGWCSGVTGTPVIVCDDFDDYCPNPPCDDAEGDDTPDQAAFLAVWPGDGCVKFDELGAPISSNALVQADAVCGEWGRTWDETNLCWNWEDDTGTTPCVGVDSGPFALRQDAGKYYPDAKDDQYILDGTSHKHDFRPRVAQLDPTKGSVNAGTDDDALVLEFVLDLPGDSMHRFSAAQANRYIELTDGSDRAPADVNIVVCGLDENPPDPKYRPQTTVDDGLDHNAIAVGVFSLLERDGDVCSAEPIPTSYRLSVYDGDRWHELRPNVPNPHPDMKVGGHHNTVTVTITASTIEIRIDSTWDQPEDGQGGCKAYDPDMRDVDGVGEPYTATATITRVYTGGFAAMHVGNGACLPSRQNDYVDNIALYGGVLGDPIPTGACCLADSSCVDDTTLAGCQNRLEGTYAGNGTDCATYSCPSPNGACCLGDGNCDDQHDRTACDARGGRFDGEFSLCGEVRCCPDPFADADADGDVDQEDFGVFQACFTGLNGGVPPGCGCYNRDGDQDIDEEDFGLVVSPNTFQGCASGPGIPADRSCDGDGP